MKLRKIDFDQVGEFFTVPQGSYLYIESLRGRNSDSTTSAPTYYDPTSPWQFNLTEGDIVPERCTIYAQSPTTMFYYEIEGFESVPKGLVSDLPATTGRILTDPLPMLLGQTANNSRISLEFPIEFEFDIPVGFKSFMASGIWPVTSRVTSFEGAPNAIAATRVVVEVSNLNNRRDNLGTSPESTITVTNLANQSFSLTANLQFENN